MGQSKSSEDYKHTRTQQRINLSEKIIMAVIDRIVNDIIRPGLVDEERECYEVAQELRDLSPDLAKLVQQILTVHYEG